MNAYDDDRLSTHGPSVPEFLSLIREADATIHLVCQSNGHLWDLAGRLQGYYLCPHDVRLVGVHLSTSMKSSVWVQRIVRQPTPRQDPRFSVGTPMIPVLIPPERNSHHSLQSQ